VLALLAAIRRGNGPLMVAAGFLGGLALHTHPSVSVFLGGLALWFLLDRGRRRWLRGPWPWLAVLAATVAYSPVIVFNLSHGLATLAEARGSRNFATESGVPWPVGVFGLLAQLGRSLGGGYRLDGPDPAWAAVSWLYTVVAGMALVWLARHPGVAVGRRLPLVVVGVSTLTLPLFNANWHGLLEARYLGYIWPLVAAAVGAVVAEAWSGARRPARVALATATIALIVLPAVRIRQLDAAARTEQVDNLRLWSMLATIEAEPTIAPVRVDENLKATGWRAGGHPRRAMEYLLTLDGVAFDRVRLDEINASLDGGAASWLLLAGPTADALAGRDLVPADVTSRPGEDHWGLYFHGTRPATPPP